MEFDFVFTYYLKKIRDKKITFEGDLKEIRGLAVSKLNIILIHLGANQWKPMFDVSEEYFILELTKTLTHEPIHILIDEEGINADKDEEDKICKRMAGQL